MLATAGQLPSASNSARWAHELKWDGVRALVTIEGGQVQVTGRSGRDATQAYPELAGLAAPLGGRSALLDGEVVTFDAAGRPSFELLQARMHLSRPGDVARVRADRPVTLLAFDLLHLSGRDTISLPYDDRRELLESLELAGPAWQVPPSFLGDGAPVLAASAAQGLEGVVSKRRDSRYEPGRRSDCWIKVKNVARQEVVIGGWEPGQGGRAGSLGALLVGVYDERGLVYAGQVGTGFSAAVLRDLGQRLGRLSRTTSPFAEPVPRPQARDARWVEPVLVAEVEFTAWTRDARLRHPSYKGLRTDKTPADVRRE